MPTNEELILQLLPVVQTKVRDFLAKAKIAGFNIRITESYRTPQRQQELYNQGRSTPGPRVTNAMGLPIPQSNHCFKVAIDVVDTVKGYNIDWEKLGKIGESCGLEWGGRWTQIVDKPHFQFTGGLTLKDLQSGKIPGEQPKPIIQPLNIKDGLYLAVEDNGKLYMVVNGKKSLIKPIGITNADLKRLSGE